MSEPPGAAEVLGALVHEVHELRMDLAARAPAQHDRRVRSDPAATVDRLDRKQPSRLNFMHFARAIPGYAGRFETKVPGNFVAQLEEHAVEVACPCGIIPGPRCEWLVPTRCECGRLYAYVGTDVRVGYTKGCQQP